MPTKACNVKVSSALYRLLPIKCEQHSHPGCGWVIPGLPQAHAPADSDFEDSERTTAWQDVHLESDDESLGPQQPGKEGHLVADSPHQSRQPSGEPKASIKFQACSTSDHAASDEVFQVDTPVI